VVEPLPRTVPARVKVLRARRIRVAKQLESLDREIGNVETGLGIRRKARRKVRARKRRPNARRLNDITVKDAIVTLLRQRRRPMHYRDIAEVLLKEKRYRTRSRNFLSTVAITILRDRRLKRMEPGVYALRASALKRPARRRPARRRSTRRRRR
jgi:hypothetical protein